MHIQFPCVLFNQLIGVGKQKVIDPAKPSFWVSDFPLPRKTTLWNSFPTTLHFQPTKILPLPTSDNLFVYPEIVSMTETPTFDEWSNTISKYKKSGIDKVVLARKTSITFKKPISPIALYHFLKQKAPNAFVFAIILSPNLAFIGATPEKLFSRIGQKIETEALAGTRRSGEEEALLRSSKDIREFLHVKETLTDQLQKICNPFSISENILIKKAGNVSHLHYPFSLELKNEISDSTLIQFLHPTPAIGGRPRDLALKFIQEAESFDRGWYAGTIGLLSNAESHLYVGIRSALLDGNMMHIFTGAGIVPDSDPLFEWDELNHKRGLYL